MNRKLILMLSLSSLIGCTETRTFVITPIEKMPSASSKAASKKIVKKYKTMVVTADKSGHKSPIQIPNYVEIYHIGPTIDANGDLVGPHKLYRVVETTRWQIGPPKTTLPIPLKPKSETVDTQVIEKAREAAREEVRSALGSKTVQVSSNNNAPSPDRNNPEAYSEPTLLDNAPSPEKRTEIESKFSIYPQNPTQPNP